MVAEAVVAEAVVVVGVPVPNNRWHRTIIKEACPKFRDSLFFKFTFHI